jgi:ubiquinone/menaquinone biosynthesis C-methylase UbiE
MSGSYYKDHWLEIEPDRLDRYEAMFKWSPTAEMVLAPAGVAPGQTIADFGCGPGYAAVELAKQVGPDGHVHAFDINAEFVARTRARAESEGLSDRVTVHQLTDGTLPLADDTLDRLVTKNVMVYVDDPAASIAEFHRVVKPGGIAHMVDSDFGMNVIDPVPAAEWRALLDAAAHAFRTPTIGRQLYGLARGAGFADVQVAIVANPDTHGRALHFANNVAGYARDGDSGIAEADIQRVVDIATNALAEGRFFALNPQFMVTCTV